MSLSIALMFVAFETLAGGLPSTAQIAEALQPRGEDAVWTSVMEVGGGEAELVRKGASQRRYILKEDVHGASSPGRNGKRLYVEEGEGEGRTTRLLASDVGGARKAPDGRLFYVQRDVLFSMDDDGTPRRHLERCTSDMVFHSSGREMLVVRLGDGDDPSELDAVDPRAGFKRRVASAGGGVLWLPLYSPDGEFAVYLSGETGMASFWRVDLANGERRQITNQGIGRHNGGVLNENFVPPAERRESLKFVTGRVVQYQAGDGDVWQLDVETGRAVNVSALGNAAAEAMGQEILPPAGKAHGSPDENRGGEEASP